MSETDELFEVKNNFYLGNYQAAINEASSVNASTESLAIEKDCYVYRCYIAQGNYSIVRDEIKDSAPTPLQAVRLLATYLSSESNRDISLDTLNEWKHDGVAANNQTFLLIAGIIYYHERNFDEALRMVHNSNILEGRALVVQIYLALNRVDLAEKEVEQVQKMDDDATLTQLATAWVALANAPDKLQDAFYIFQELIDKYSPTPVLLNGIALCHILQGKYVEAERYLLEAIEKNPTDPETLVNLIACFTHQGKSRDVINRYVKQAKTNCGNHLWVKQLQDVDDLFERAAKQYS